MLHVIVDEDDNTESTRLVNQLHDRSQRWAVVHLGQGLDSLGGAVLRAVGRPPEAGVSAERCLQRAAAWLHGLNGWNLVFYGAWRVGADTAEWLNEQFAGQANTAWLVTHLGLSFETKRLLRRLVAGPFADLTKLLAAKPTRALAASGDVAEKGEVAAAGPVTAEADSGSGEARFDQLRMRPWPWGLMDAFAQAPHQAEALHASALRRISGVERAVDAARLVFDLLAATPNRWYRQAGLLAAQDAAFRAGWYLHLPQELLLLGHRDESTAHTADPVLAGRQAAHTVGAGGDVHRLHFDTARREVLGEDGRPVGVPASDPVAALWAAHTLGVPDGTRPPDSEELSVSELLRRIDFRPLWGHDRWAERNTDGPASYCKPVTDHLAQRPLQAAEAMLLAQLHSCATVRKPLAWHPDDRLDLGTLQRLKLVEADQQGHPVLVPWLDAWLVDRRLAA